ncbi:MAG: hypothetical protein AAF844_00750 [Pseudomonadota bacterium]
MTAQIGLRLGVLASDLMALRRGTGDRIADQALGIAFRGRPV